MLHCTGSAADHGQDVSIFFSFRLRSHLDLQIRHHSHGYWKLEGLHWGRRCLLRRLLTQHRRWNVNMSFLPFTRANPLVKRCSQISWPCHPPCPPPLQFGHDCLAQVNSPPREKRAIGPLFHHKPLFSEIVIAAQGCQSLFWAMGPSALLCAGSITQRRPLQQLAKSLQH